MIDWDKIIKSHVIRTFQQICYKWWGIDIQFFDEHLNCKSNNIPLKNPLCHLIHSTPMGTNLCLRSCKEHLKGLNKLQNILIYRCHAGLHGIAVPVLAKESYVGSMIGSGIRLSKSKETDMEIRKLIKLGFDKTVLKQCYNKTRIVDSHSEAFIYDFMELITKDIESYCGMLLEKEETIKKQAVLLEKIYNKKYNEIVGKCTAMKKVFDALEMIENSEGPVLIEGETGTGKELIAVAIHYNSHRKNKPYIIQNCSAFSDTLLNSELFGHEKGSFTGAISDKKGLFEVADGGTLFLDEIGDTSPDIQAKLLRVLEKGTFYSIGGTEQKKVDVRIVAATNKELKKQVEKGLFRKDLFYRINTLYITIPPLRERKEDIPILIIHFLDNHAEIPDIGKREISPDVIEILMAYHWPGNVRELENMIERMITLSGKNKTIVRKHIPMEIMSASSTEPCVLDRKKGQTLRDAMKTFEKELIRKELKRTNWNKKTVSKELGISRTTLYDKIVQYSIQPDT